MSNQTQLGLDGIHTHYCARCGTGFDPVPDHRKRGRKAKYCSAKCRVYASRERKRAQKAAAALGGGEA